MTEGEADPENGDLPSSSSSSLPQHSSSTQNKSPHRGTINMSNPAGVFSWFTNTLSPGSSTVSSAPSSVWLIPCCATAFVTLLVIPSIILARRIIRPTVLSYPWKTAETSAERIQDKKKVVVLAGSYNPPHYGHLAMLEYLAMRYGEVIAVIGMNPKKKYDVTPAERARFLEDMVKGCDIKGKIRVEVVSGYIWRFAMQNKVQIFYRGIRSWKVDGKEERILHVLNTIGPLLLGPLKWPIPTHYLEGKPEYNHISSTLIRTKCQEAKGCGRKVDLSALVPKVICDSVAEAYVRS